MAPPFPGIEVDVQSTHVDMFGHLNHTRYLEFMEWARFAWALHHGFPIDRMVRDQRIGPAVLRVNIAYRREVRLGDRLKVTVEPQSRRRAIGVLRQRIIDLATDEVASDAELAFVMMHMDTRRAVPLPEEFLATLP